MADSAASIDVEVIFKPEESATFVEGEILRQWSQCLHQLKSLRALKRNWDDAGAPPVPRLLSDFVQGLLEQAHTDGRVPPSRVVPTPSGTISIEWQLPNLYVEVEVVGSGVLEWIFQYPDGRIEHDTDDESRITTGIVEDPACLDFGEFHSAVAAVA